MTKRKTTEEHHSDVEECSSASEKAATELEDIEDSSEAPGLPTPPKRTRRKSTALSTRKRVSKASKAPAPPKKNAAKRSKKADVDEENVLEDEASSYDDTRSRRVLP